MKKYKQRYEALHGKRKKAKKMVYENRNVRFECDVEIDEQEADNYISRGIDLYGDSLVGIKAHIDGEDVELSYIHESPKFTRIRRITGYLVGSLDRFNDAKLSEVNDRVKHGLGV